MDIPGSSGWRLIGDKSIQFYKNPMKFCVSNAEYYKSKVFLSRLLNKPTVFVTNFLVAREIMRESDSKVINGYRKYWLDLFGESIIFQDGTNKSKGKIQEFIKNFTKPENWKKMSNFITREVENIKLGKPIDFYTFSKHLSTGIWLSFIFNHHYSETSQSANIATDTPEFQELISLTLDHWHGIISVPVALKLPAIVGGSTSSYKKALVARSKLEQLLTACWCGDSNKSNDEIPALADLLLMSSALVPKSMASLLTNLVAMIAHQPIIIEESSQLPMKSILNCYLLECIRLWPPYVGLLRQVVMDFELCGHKFNKDQFIFINLALCHQDNQCFEEPSQFNPFRWLKHLIIEETTDHQNGCMDESSIVDSIIQEKLLSLGQGSCTCPGLGIVTRITVEILEILLHELGQPQFDPAKQSPISKFLPFQNNSHKWLPVSKPVHPVNVLFSK